MEPFPSSPTNDYYFNGHCRRGHCASEQSYSTLNSSSQSEIGTFSQSEFGMSSQSEFGMSSQSEFGMSSQSETDMSSEYERTDPDGRRPQEDELDELLRATVEFQDNINGLEERIIIFERLKCDAVRNLHDLAEQTQARESSQDLERRELEDRNMLHLLGSALQAHQNQVNRVIENLKAVIHAHVYAVQRLARQPVNFSAFLEMMEPIGVKLLSALMKSLTLAQKLGLYHQVQSLAHQERAMQQLANGLEALFVIVEQPPRIIKGKESFSTSIRLLVGQSLGIHSNEPPVGISVLSEEQARFYASIPWRPIAAPIGHVSPSFVRLKLTEGALLSYKFESMNLTRMRRTRGDSETPGRWTVCDETFCLFFQSLVLIGNMQFRIKRQSLPLLFMAEGSETIRSAALFWDSVLAETHNYGFVDPPEGMPWGKVAYRLSETFLTQTSRGLSRNHLKFMYQLVSQNWENLLDENADIVTFTDFCKRELPRAQIDFWRWFINAQSLCEAQLRDPWIDGNIEGFIRSTEAMSLLERERPGTFLIRFDEFYPCALSIFYVAEQNGFRRIRARALDKREILTLGLENVVLQMKELQYVYPGRPKEEAFARYCITR